MLIHVAGTDHEGAFLDQTRGQILSILRLNIEAVLDLTHALIERRDPLAVFRIINVASLAAFYPMPMKATYAASKRFLLDFSLALGEEVREMGATVTRFARRVVHHARMHRGDRRPGAGRAPHRAVDRRGGIGYAGLRPERTIGLHPGDPQPDPSIAGRLGSRAVDLPVHQPEVDLACARSGARWRRPELYSQDENIGQDLQDDQDFFFFPVHMLDLLSCPIIWNAKRED